eukprot:Hpha_TRINITY_DN16327_c0_g1::TRINITY_DN16327_c0_g1_i1::g.59550::m.59550
MRGGWGGLGGSWAPRSSHQEPKDPNRGGVEGRGDVNISVGGFFSNLDGDLVTEDAEDDEENHQLDQKLAEGAQGEVHGGLHKTGTKHLHSRLLERRVGGEAGGEECLQHRQVVERRVLHQYCLFMGEGVERAAPVVRTHSGLTHTAEGQLVVGQVHNGVVDAQPSAGGPLGNSLDHTLVPCVAVACKGLTGGEVADELNDILHVGKTGEGEEGAEDLVLHQGGLGKGGEVGTVVEEGGGHKPVCGVGSSTKRDFVLGALHQLVEALEGLFVDNTSEVLSLLCVLTVELTHGLLHDGDKLVGHRFVDEAEVGAHAGLTRVEESRPGNALRGVLEVRALVNDGRTLATQFQHCRCQVLRRSLRHQLPDETTACEEYGVELLLQNLGSQVAVALRDADGIPVQVAVHKAADRV